MLKIGSVRWRGKCSRHPAFDPHREGREAIKAGCERCAALAEIHACHERMLALMRGFAPARSGKRLQSVNREMQPSLFGEV